MTPPLRSNGWRLLPEMLLTLLVVAGLIHCINRFLIDGRLPQPFIYDMNDTFMDWFNTAYWAHNSGAFDVWRTVYPPLSFVFLKVFTNPECYASDPFTARDCDTYGIASIMIWYGACIVIAALAFYKNDRETALPRALSFGLGLPLLFTLERGNLILPAFCFFVLAHSELVRAQWVRVISAGVSINFKPYLLVPVAAWAFQRRWRSLELAGFATVSVLVLSLAAFGDGTLPQMVGNTGNWVQFMSVFKYENVYYSTSFTPFLDFDTHRFPFRDFVPSGRADALFFWIPVVIKASQALAILTFAGIFLQPRAVSASRISTLALAIYLVSQTPGGYTQTFLVFLVFLEPWRRTGPIIAVAMAYLLCNPYDYVVSNFFHLTSSPSWLAQRPTTADFGVAVGMFLRPGLIVILFWALALDTLGQIAKAHRQWRPSLDLRPITKPELPRFA